MSNTLEELIAQIKDRLDIVEVVSERVILKKNGGHFWGLCPFHKEKTPSFSVNPNLGIYKCFGCGEGGERSNLHNENPKQRVHRSYQRTCGTLWS